MVKIAAGLMNRRFFILFNDAIVCQDERQAESAMERQVGSLVQLAAGPAQLAQ